MGQHRSTKWVGIVGFAVAAVVAILVWRYQTGPVVVPFGNARSTAAQFRRDLPPLSAVTGAYVVGGPGEDQPVRRVRANRTMTVARLVLRTLDQGTPVHARVATPPSFGDYAVQLTLDDGEAMTVEPATYYHGSARHFLAGFITYGMSTRGGNGVRTTVVKDAALYHWLTSRGWSRDLKNS